MFMWRRQRYVSVSIGLCKKSVGFTEDVSKAEAIVRPEDSWSLSPGCSSRELINGQIMGHTGLFNLRVNQNDLPMVTITSPH